MDKDKIISLLNQDLKDEHGAIIQYLTHAYAAILANALRPNLKFISIIGSYGWGGKAVEQLAAMIPNLKVEILEPVLSKGFPKEADFKALDSLADTIAQKHKESHFV